MKHKPKDTAKFVVPSSVVGHLHQMFRISGVLLHSLHHPWM